MILGDRNRKVCEEIQDSSYDVAIIMGGFAQSHLPVNSLYQVPYFLKLVSHELIHFGVIARFFWQIGGHSSRLVLFLDTNSSYFALFDEFSL